MGSFGTAVTSLLDTYTKCLSLLKSHRGDGDNGGDDASSDSLQSLGNSLHSDRARVRRAYSSHLLRNGAQFEKGDVASQSALDRIVKRLTAALNKVVRSFGSRQPPMVDYNTLLALSHGTSLDAVRTIEDLSHRVNSGTSSDSSRHSVAGKGKKQGRHHSRPRQSEAKPKKPKAVKTPKAKSRRSKSKSSSSTSQSSSRSSTRRRQKTSQNQPSKKKTSAAENRISLITIASDSTKLGEIRRRESRQGLRIPNTAYPLYMYPPEEGKKRKKWWKVFGSE